MKQEVCMSPKQQDDILERVAQKMGVAPKDVFNPNIAAPGMDTVPVEKGKIHGDYGTSLQAVFKNLGIKPSGPIYVLEDDHPKVRFLNYRDSDAFFSRIEDDRTMAQEMAVTDRDVTFVLSVGHHGGLALSKPPKNPLKR